jgi:hypothetical protein
VPTGSTRLPEHKYRLLFPEVFVALETFVIFDLHLGGAPGKGEAPGFQMCQKPAQERLGSFLDWLSEQAGTHAPERIHLVVNGDVVDLLAEEPFAAFSTQEAA